MHQRSSKDSPFWVAAKALQVVREAMPESADSSWSAVQSMIRRMLSVQVVAEQGGNAKSMLVEAWREDEELTAFLSMDPDVRFLMPGSDNDFYFPMIGMMDSDACCATIDAYSKPVPMPPQQGKSLAPQVGIPDDEAVEGSLISASFSVKAHFKEGVQEDGVSCKCACCEFRAYA